MTYLYKLESEDFVECTERIPDILLKEFTPSLGKLFLSGENRNAKIACVRIVFQIISLGRAKLYYVQSAEGQVLHTSWAVPSRFKFAFMTQNDCEIGPCYTYPAYRGRGIYPWVLREIGTRLRNKYSTFYIIVDETNKPSIRGIEKAGFIRCGIVQKKRFSKRYYLIKS